ncbi:MAG: adenylyl-sulfate kinase [Proteobacteria bacterium]|jgi:adenylylsulfate kinase|nr:adenylyl-sulfate kinase [Pseudomonadota bacterium]
MNNKATNVTWQKGDVNRGQREKFLGQKGCTVWFTGLSGSGKSTVAIALEHALTNRGKLSYRLDGDNIRLGINKNLGFDHDDRTENIRRVGEVSKLFADAGIMVLSSFISPYESDRNMVRDAHQTGGLPFLEVYVDCSLECAESRDPKGLYKKAREGKILDFTGIDSPYESPKQPDIHLHTEHQSVEQEVDVLIAKLEQLNLLPKLG